MDRRKYWLYKGYAGSVYVSEPTESKYMPIYFGMHKEPLLVAGYMPGRLYYVSLIPSEEAKYTYAGKRRDIRFIGRCLVNGRYIRKADGKYGEHYTVFEIVHYPEQLWSIRTMCVQRWLGMTQKIRFARVRGCQLLTKDVVVKGVEYGVNEDDLKQRTYVQLDIRKNTMTDEERERLFDEMQDDMNS